MKNDLQQITTKLSFKSGRLGVALVLLSIVSVTPLMSLSANRDLLLVQGVQPVMANGVEPMVLSAPDPSDRELSADDAGIEEQKKSGLQLEVCLRYMESKGNNELRDLVRYAISLDKKSTVAEPLDYNDVLSLSRKVEYLRFADVAEMCVHAARKVIGEKKTAEFFTGTH